MTKWKIMEEAQKNPAIDNEKMKIITEEERRMKIE